MKVAIMQPTYLPWLGYFHLINSVDVFIYLDDVQYERGTWHQRNRVLVNGVPAWLTVPVIRKSLGDLISEVSIDDKKNWRNKHSSTILSSYSRHPHTNECLDLVNIIKDVSLAKLLDLNVALIEAACQSLNINTKRILSSSLKVEGVRTQKIINICHLLGADVYVSPPGASAYLVSDNFRDKTHVDLQYNDYNCIPYPQVGATEFISHLSILDALCNLGWSSLTTLLSHSPFDS